MKTILGLDLGTNSIGWSVVQYDEQESSGEIIGAGSRIIPMDQSILGEFERGNKVSQTAERTRLRSVRRLYERANLRRERLHRVLNRLGFLPEHYAAEIDFEFRLGQFKNHAEPKINYKKNNQERYEFLFQSSFDEMLADFGKSNPEATAGGKKIPYDWTIYYLRKKALTRRIEKEELAWILLNFNQKRGYYQLRGEEEGEEEKGKRVEFYSLRVVEVIASDDKKGDNIWYNVVLENGWVYRRQSRTPLDWVGKTKDFIVTTEIDEDGNVKKNKEGEERRSFRAPGENDWGLVKIKTEREIDEKKKTVGCYIYDTLLVNPSQKVRGKLIHTIERKYYKTELGMILDKQKEFHPELTDNTLYKTCVEELYPHNLNHRASLENKDLAYFLIEDILFYQRPLKTQKGSIDTCPYETYFYKDKAGNKVKAPINCIPKSHPLFQEFRLWQFVQYLKIYKRVGEKDGKPEVNIEVTDDLLATEQDLAKLFDWLNDKKEIKQDTLLKYPGFGLKKDISNYRWNYIEDRIYPCNETRALIHAHLQKAGIGHLEKEDELALWHILYSVEDKIELAKALTSFADKKDLPEKFVEVFRKFPSFEKEYGAYSAKAIAKLLPLMRCGKHWNEVDIDKHTKQRIDKLIDGEWDESIAERVRKKIGYPTSINDFRRLPLWLACYVVYNRHSEGGDIQKWNTPADIDYYLNHVFKQHSLRNPIVEQVLTETLRVVRDIWQKYGEGHTAFFDEIHVELGRDIKSTADKRKRLSQDISRNENTNLRIKAMLAEFKESGMIENVRPYSPMQQEILKIYEEGVLTSGINIPEDVLKISTSAQPSQSELQRYRLWLEQKYCSPYTGKVISLAELFTPAYEIEHIIPQSRYFDDSLSNKVICEAAVNKDKGNKLGYEYIKANGGRLVEAGFGKPTPILTVAEYEAFIKSRYSDNKAKMKKLLLEDIPEEFIARQLNDSRYISRKVQELLSAIVRQENEQETVSKNIVSCNGVITAELKHHWGLNDVWNEIITPRFERLNQLTNSCDYGEWTNKGGKRVFQTKVPLAISKGFNRKRIDHRHHALDAIAIACATRSHINYLNNRYAKTKEERYDLRSKLCEKHKSDDKGNYNWVFKKPWATLTQDTRDILLSIIVSFKQNLRVINKSVNHYQKWKLNENGTYQKVFEKQLKGDNWAIRKPMHKETIYGKIKLRHKKLVNLSVALDSCINKESKICLDSLVDKELKAFVKALIEQYGQFDKKTILKYFKDRNNVFQGKNIAKVEIYYFDENNAVSRTPLDISFNTKKIDSISSSSIRSILKKHLENYNEIKGDKVIEHPELAFSPDGIDEMNKNIVALNNGHFHKPIYRVRTYEPIGNKFHVGNNGNRSNMYVVAAKGTNLYFAIYQDGTTNKSYETIPLEKIIERLKQGLNPVPEQNDKGFSLLFSLSPNGLVYVPTEEELETGNIDWSDRKKIVRRTYKMVSSTMSQCFFIPAFVAFPIVPTFEFNVKNKIEKSEDGMLIKEVGVKLNLDRLGF